MNSNISSLISHVSLYDTLSGALLGVLGYVEGSGRKASNDDREPKTVWVTPSLPTSFVPECFKQQSEIWTYGVSLGVFYKQVILDPFLKI